MVHYVSEDKECVSFSDMSTWLQCPQKYIFKLADKYNNNVNNETTEALEKGIAIHKRLEDGENILNVFDLLCVTNTKKRKHELIFDTTVKNLSINKKSNLDKLYEKRYGTIDLLYNITDNKQLVVDFKTTSSYALVIPEIAILQTTWYAMNVGAEEGAIALIQLDKKGEPKDLLTKHFKVSDYEYTLLKLLKAFSEFRKEFLTSNSNNLSLLHLEALQNFQSCRAYFRKCEFYSTCH